jgi:hypothetical protein
MPFPSQTRAASDEASVVHLFTSGRVLSSLPAAIPLQWDEEMSMQPIPRVLLFCCALSLILTPDLQALRCGNDLVSPGDRMFEVLQLCGEPDYREVRDDKRFFRIFRDGRFIEILEEVEVEEWTYNLGPYQFIRILRFENGRLVEIETGDYGF